MYRLMKSDRFTLDHATSGRMSLYRQTEIDQFEQFPAAAAACTAANRKGGIRHYLVNASGREYYGGIWID